MLLIVPYGIETLVGGMLRAITTLLIVPYGIETDSRVQQQDKRHVF